jgi:hypothetical protein
MIATYYMEPVVEMEDVANVKKRRGRVDGGAKRYAVPVCPCLASRQSNVPWYWKTSTHSE